MLDQYSNEVVTIEYIIFFVSGGSGDCAELHLRRAVQGPAPRAGGGGRRRRMLRGHRRLSAGRGEGARPAGAGAHDQQRGELPNVHGLPDLARQGIPTCSR
jgi:hypothetical protein